MNVSFISKVKHIQDESLEHTINIKIYSYNFKDYF